MHVKCFAQFTGGLISHACSELKPENIHYLHTEDIAIVSKL